MDFIKTAKKKRKNCPVLKIKVMPKSF